MKGKVAGSIPAGGSIKTLSLCSCSMDIQILAREFYDYSNFMRGYSKSTIRRYRHAINSYSKFTGVTKIEDVNREDIRRLLFDGRTRRHWRTNTFISLHKSLAVFFRWCVSEGHMGENPMDDIELPKLENRLPSRLKKEEALRLIEVATNYPYENDFLRHRNNAIFSTFLYTGLRKKELLNLKFGDVDLQNLSIFVRQGKGNKDRIVPICYALAHSLERYLAERKRLSKTCAEFFTSYTLNHGYTESGLNRLVVQMREASGIKFTIHKLRHTFATLMLEGGCDIYSLSRMMGHSDIKTTTIYLSASAEHLRSQITKHPLNPSH